MAEAMTQEVATIPVEDFKALAESAPVALEKNRTTLEKAQAKGAKLRATLTEREMDDDLAEQLKEYMGSLSEAKEKSNGRRTPFTRMIQNATKVFTAIENWYDDEKKFFQNRLDEYSARLIREQREREQKAQVELAKSRERIEVTSKLEADLSSHLAGQISKMRDKLFSNFNGVSLENYDKACAHFKGLTFAYTQTDFNSWTPFVGSRILSDEELIEIQRKVKEGKYESFKNEFVNQLSITLEEIIDKLPGKKTELEEIKAAKGKEAEKLKLEAEARAKEEAEKRAADEAAAKAKAEADASAKKDVAMAETLFDHEATLAQVSPEAPKGREGYEITVKAPPGIMLIFNLWYQNEGRNLTVDQILKKKVDSMVSFCEKWAHIKGEKIDSPLITYTETFKTSTRR